MCRICGRVVKCIFDSMPSRASSSSALTKRQPFQQPPNQTRSHHVSSRSIVRGALNVSSSSSSSKLSPPQPPTFLLPFRAKLHQAATQQAASQSAEYNTPPGFPPPTLRPTPTPTTTTTTSALTTSDSPSRPLVLSKSVQDLLPRICAQKPHYVVAHVHRFPYLLTEGDVLRLPFDMKDVSPGDVLRFNRASVLGSRDYTLKAGMKITESYDTRRTGEPQYLDERLFECRLRVMGHETGPMMNKEKKKRRNRHRKVVHSKHRYTVLRVMQIRVKPLDELKREQGPLLLEGAGLDTTSPA